MPSNDNSASTRPTARRKDPACGTCRKKCRKCDRKRPICDRCRTKGLHCEGYPPRFQFQFQETLVIAPGQGPQEASPDIADVSPTQVVEDCSLPESLEASDTTEPDFSLQQTILDTSALALTSLLSSATPTLSPPQESFDGRVCESGVSTHGAHLTGVSFLCKRMACRDDFSTRSKAGMFLISALSWLDMLRGFSGAEKLAYSEEVRKCVRDHGSLSLHTLVGCPPVIFFKIGQVLEAGKKFLAGNLPLEGFERLLDGAERFLRGWDPDQAVYPTAHQEWRQLAEAYRHACLLRVMRFPDTFAISCDDPRIKASVAAVLDICTTMPRDSVFYKRLLFPLFLAGADTCSPHQIHYASWCISEIKHSTGFEHPAMTEVLTKVWEARRTNPHGWSNIPWMEFTCSELLRSQHAYLFF
ncbi:hypothetical protein ACHAPI_009208 [Fusarium lateritium]